jgi:hypothetical protein
VRRRPRPSSLSVGVPAELADPAAAVWHDEVTYRDYMAANGWRLPARSLLGVESGPAARRRAAVAAWARDAGVTITDRPVHPDWHRLRAMGLLTDRRGEL